MAKVKRNNRRRLFVVEGSGAFPFDMLRYDQCWPRDGAGSTVLPMMHRRRVVLVSDWFEAPSARRWEASAWQVIDQGFEQ